MFVNPYAGLSDLQKREKLDRLLCVYEALMAGQSVEQIDDEGRTGVKYRKTDVAAIAAQILRLQMCLGLVPDCQNPYRAVRINY